MLASFAGFDDSVAQQSNSSAEYVGAAPCEEKKTQELLDSQRKAIKCSSSQIRLFLAVVDS